MLVNFFLLLVLLWNLKSQIFSEVVPGENTTEVLQMTNNVNKSFLQSTCPPTPTHTHGSTLIEHCVGCFKLRAADPV